jgi:hypothetical protein
MTSLTLCHVAWLESWLLVAPCLALLVVLRVWAAK